MNSTNASYTYDGLTGVMDSLGDVGIGTTGTDNQLSITDGTKLDYLLANNFDKVQQLFRGVPATQGYAHGVADDLYVYAATASSSMIGTIAQHTTSIEKSVTDYTAKINRMNADLINYETQLWAQFTHMEDAIATMQSETSMITGLTSGGK